MDTPLAPDTSNQLTVPSIMDIAQTASDSSSILESGVLITQGRRLMGTTLIGVVPFPKKITPHDSHIWDQLIQDCKEIIEQPVEKANGEETFRRLSLEEREKIRNYPLSRAEEIETWDEFFEISEGETEEDVAPALSGNIENRWDMNSYFESLRGADKVIRRLTLANIPNAVLYDKNEEPFLTK